MLQSTALAVLLAGCAAPVQDTKPPAAPVKLFAVTFRTGPSWDAAKPPGEQRYFKDHSANIRHLKTEGRLVVGGRFGELGLLLVRAETQADAQALVDRDPSVANGVFKAEVHPWSTFATGCVE